MKDKMKKEDREAFQRNVKQLKYLLGHKELGTILSLEAQKVVKKGFGVLHKQLASEDFSKEATGKEKSIVKEALNIILSAVMNQSMKPILQDLGKEFGLLAFNWNQVFGKRPDIAETTIFIKNIVRGVLSLTQAIEVIRGLVRQVKQMEGCAPPAYDLSRAYLKTFEEEGKKEDSQCKKKR